MFEQCADAEANVLPDNSSHVASSERTGMGRDNAVQDWSQRLCHQRIVTILRFCRSKSISSVSIAGLRIPFSRKAQRGRKGADRIFFLMPLRPLCAFA